MNAKDRLVARTAEIPTPALISALRLLEATAPRTPETILVRVTMIEELERRYPAAAAAVLAAFEAEDAAFERGEEVPSVDYVAVLTANIPV